MPKHKFTRIELHELLWQKSTTQVAKELDIKASHIRKICKHYDIPLPKSGYWSKIAFNKKVKIQGLYNLERFKSDIIDLKEPFEDERDHYLTKLSRRTKEIELQFPSAVKVKDRLSNSDPLIQRTRTHIKKQKPSSWGGIERIRTYGDYLGIEVTKSTVDRALRFYDCFIKLLRLRGHEIYIDTHSTKINVYKEEYVIRLREKGNRITNTESSYPTSQNVPNGKLSIKLDESFKSVEWNDGSKRIEEQLARIMAAIELKALKDIEYQKQLEIGWAEQARKQKIREAEQAEIKWSNHKVDMLLEHSKNWTEAQNLINFISEIERKGNLTEEKIDWIAWSKRVVVYLDPLSGGVDNLIDKYNFKHSDFHK